MQFYFPFTALGLVHPKPAVITAQNRHDSQAPHSVNTTLSVSY